jgi:predicted GNAT family acetyltransferase
MKCKLILNGKIKHYGYFDEDKQIGKCCVKEYTKGELAGCYLLFGVSINEEYRGKGLCTQFLKCVLKKYTGKTIFLTVLMDNIPALKCYEHLGFKEIDKGRKTLYMRKE